MECVLRSRGDEDRIARGRSREAEGRGELSCKRKPESSNDMQIQRREEKVERSCCSCRTRPNWDVSLEEASTVVDSDGASPTSVYSPQPVAEEAESRTEMMDDSARTHKRQRES